MVERVSDELSDDEIGLQRGWLERLSPHQFCGRRPEAKVARESPGVSVRHAVRCPTSAQVHRRSVGKYSDNPIRIIRAIRGKSPRPGPVRCGRYHTTCDYV